MNSPTAQGPTLVMTVGKNPSPIVFSLLHFRPCQAVLLYTRGGGTKRIAKAVRDAVSPVTGTEFTLVSLGRDAGDFKRVARCTAGVVTGLPEGWRCDYTGGSKVMAAVLAEAHLRANGGGGAPLRSYVDEPDGAVVCDDGSRTPLRLKGLTLEMLWQAHVWTLNGSLINGWPSDGPADTAKQARCLIADGRLVDNAKDPLCEALQQGLATGAAGNPFERLVAALVAYPLLAENSPASWPIPDELIMNPKMHDIDVEIDVVARYGPRVLCISCKGTHGDGHAHAWEVMANAGEIGADASTLFGTAARPAIAARQQQARQIISDALVGPDGAFRAPVVFDSADIAALCETARGAGGCTLGDLAAERGLGPLRPQPRPACATSQPFRIDLPPEGLVPALPRRGSASAGQAMVDGQLAAMLFADPKPVLVTALSGNPLATVAAMQGWAPDRVIVVETAGFTLNDDRRRAIAGFLAGGATLQAVSVPRDHAPSVFTTIANAVAERAPVVIDITAGTKAISVGLHMAALALSARGVDVMVCYADLDINKVRWWCRNAGPPYQDSDFVPPPLSGHETLALHSALSKLSFDCITPERKEELKERSDYLQALAVAIFALPLGGNESAHEITVRLEDGGTQRLYFHLVLFAGSRPVVLCAPPCPRQGKEDEGWNQILLAERIAEVIGGAAARVAVLDTRADAAAVGRRQRRANQVSVRRFPPVLFPKKDWMILLDPGADERAIANFACRVGLLPEVAQWA